MRRQLLGFCHWLFDVMTFNAVDGTSPLDIVIPARMIQVIESDFAERRLFSKDDRLRLRCRLLLAGTELKLRFRLVAILCETSKYATKIIASIETSRHESFTFFQIVTDVDPDQSRLKNICGRIEC
jgi:hypothetical protein